MSALKDQDPDYGPSDASDEKHQRIYEENGIYEIFYQIYAMFLLYLTCLYSIYFNIKNYLFVTALLKIECVQ